MARSPYVKPFRKLVTVAFTEEQYQVLTDYCEKAHVSMANAVRDAFVQVHPVPEEKE